MRSLLILLIGGVLGLGESLAAPKAESLNIAGENPTLIDKRKVKKVIRKAGRIYRTVKPAPVDKKKSRTIQRKARRIVNIL